MMHGPINIRLPCYVVVFLCVKTSNWTSIPYGFCPCIMRGEFRVKGDCHNVKIIFTAILTVACHSAILNLMHSLQHRAIFTDFWTLREVSRIKSYKVGLIPFLKCHCWFAISYHSNLSYSIPKKFINFCQAFKKQRTTHSTSNNTNTMEALSASKIHAFRRLKLEIRIQHCLINCAF